MNRLAIVALICGGPALLWFLPGPERSAGSRPAPLIGSMPAGARGAALARARSAGLTDAPGNWTNVGPVNVGGRVTAIGVDPNDPARIWVGAAAGGVFLTEDEGVTFSPVFDDQPTLSVGSLAVHPTDSNVVWVGTGEDNGGGYSYDGEGVFKTVDGGQTWVQLGLAETRRIGRMAVDPTDGDRIFVAAGGDWFTKDPHRGIYRSLDGGQTWSKVLFVADDAGGIDVAIDPLNPSRVFAAIWQRHSFGTGWYVGGVLSGIYRSQDGGDSWTRLTNGLPTGEMGRIGIAIAPGDPSTVYANIIARTGGLLGIYRSQDGGDSWTRRDNSAVGGWYSSFGYYFSQIRVDPGDTKTVYMLDIRLLISTNGAKSVQPLAGPVHVDWHDLIVEPGGRWLAGTDGGFYVSQDEGGSWFHADSLPITQFYDLGIDRIDPNRRFAGSQDNGTLRTVDGGSSSWGEVLFDDGLQCEVDYTDSAKVYASTQFGGFHRSTDGGDSFVAATGGIDPSDRVNWNAPLQLDPSVPTTMYTGTFRVYRSTDSMMSWSAISPDLTSGAAHEHDEEARDGPSHLRNLVEGTISAIAVSPADVGVIWAGTDDGNVWVTSNGGGSWTPVSPPGPAYWVTDLEPDPYDPDTAYLTVTGYREGDRMPYVRVTTDRGQSWTDVGGNLPQVPVNALIVDPDWRGRLFAGTDLGVHVSDNAGESWSAMRGGMPFTVVHDLVRHDPTITLFAATHGRSIYTFDLAQLGPADGDGDGVDNNLDCALADPGAFAPPAEVPDLTVGSTLLSWGSLSAQAGPGTLYDLARGMLGDWTGSGSLACGVAGTSHPEPDSPAPAVGFYYLVRGVNACGAGTWGLDSGGAERNSVACP